MSQFILKVLAFLLFSAGFFALARLIILIHYNLHKLISWRKDISGRVVRTTVEKVQSGGGFVGRGSGPVIIFSHYFNALLVNTYDGDIITIYESKNSEEDQSYSGSINVDDHVNITGRRYRSDVYMTEPIFEDFYRIKG